MALAQAITIGDQVRLHFVGWPNQVKALKKVNGELVEVAAPHPKEGQPFVPTWNSRPYPVMPGQDVYVPFELAKLYFGDPRSVENVFRIKDEWGGPQIIPDRFAEVRRLQGFWQNSIIQFREYIPGDRTFMADGISDLIPNVEIYSLSGERILMVTDDPYGDTVVVATSTKAEDAVAQQIMLDQSQAIVELRKTNELLLKKLGIRLEDLTTLDDPDIPPAPKVLDGALTTPINATTQEQPQMVFNPRTRRVEERRTPPGADPTVITELPIDTD